MHISIKLSASFHLRFANHCMLLKVNFLISLGAPIVSYVHSYQRTVPANHTDVQNYLFQEGLIQEVSASVIPTYFHFNHNLYKVHVGLLLFRSRLVFCNQGKKLRNKNISLKSKGTLMKEAASLPVSSFPLETGLKQGATFTYRNISRVL